LDRVVRDDGPARAGDGFDDGLHIEWNECPQIDDFGADVVFGGEGVGGGQGVVHAASVADDADVGTRPFDVGLPERDRETLIGGHRPLLAL
jgi:hypothetical protein